MGFGKKWRLGNGFGNSPSGPSLNRVGNVLDLIGKRFVPVTRAGALIWANFHPG